MRRALIPKHLCLKGFATPPPDSLSQMMKKWTQGERNDFVTNYSNLYGFEIARLRKDGLWDIMESQERDFMQVGVMKVTMRDLIDAAWLAEPAFCLLWSLGGVGELPPYDRQADPRAMNHLLEESAEVLAKSATLRLSGELMRQRELAELWHWRARTRQLQESGQKLPPLPGSMKLADVIEKTADRAAKDGVFPAPLGNDFPAFGKPYRELTPAQFSRATSIARERQRAFNWVCGYAPGNKWSATPTDA
jgi:hypothetical protein